MSGCLGVTVHNVGTFGVAVDSGRVKRGVDLVGKLRGIVVESSARINLSTVGSQQFLLIINVTARH